MSATVSPDTQYCLRRDLQIRITDGCHLSVQLPQGSFSLPLAALKLLETFVEPRTFAEAADHIAAAGSNDWIHKTAILRSMVDIGVLVPKGAAGEPLQATVRIHIDMLNDQARTVAYQRALRELVKPGDRVLDIGTGTGVLAVTAAQAGAAKVYALEANPVAVGIARETLRKNGLDDRVEVIQGWSTSLELPERVDLVVSEMFGNDPFDEDILLIYADAVKRFAKPGARLIPQTFDLCCAPLQLSPEQLARYIPGEADLARWQADYEVDLSALAQLDYPDNLPLLYSKPQKLAGQVAGESMHLGRVCLGDTQPINPRFSLPLTTETGGFNALMLYFEAELSPDNWLSLAPTATSASNHWSMPVWHLPEMQTPGAGKGRTLRFERTHTGKNRLFID